MSPKAKNATIQECLTVIDDCLSALPGEGGQITADMLAKIEAAKESLELLLNTEKIKPMVACTKRPSTAP